MKKNILSLTVLIALTTNVYAQVPNGGFEEWTAVGSYEDPSYWGSTNSFSTGQFYAITKSTDHYPSSVGSYSLRIESNISLLPDYAGRGFVSTGQPPPHPNFSIADHPTSLTGYYKFAPQNGDTMFINVLLFNNGSFVSNGEFSTTSSASNWTPFNIPLSDYTNADSGSIIISAYYATGFNAIPHGNSVLYVDNLNFDNLISTISEKKPNNHLINLYPNPASDVLTFDLFNYTSALTLNIYSLDGILVKSETIKQNQRKINIEDLNNGIYVAVFKTNDWIGKQKLIIQK